MENDYQDIKNAQNYADFLDSTNGQIQQKILLKAILKSLSPSPESVLLDAACGTGWLAAELKNTFPKTYACDSSKTLIDLAKHRHSAVEFSHADILTQLPYPDGFFDSIILNMAAPDLNNLSLAVKNLTLKLKMGGNLIITAPNPYLTFPVAVWKRSLLDVLLFRKPNIKIFDNHFKSKPISREFNGKKIDSNFYTLTDYFTAATNSCLNLINFIELKSQTDSPRFDLNYQMFRYPLILLMDFKK